MQRQSALGLMRRAIDIVEKQWPEMAERPMKVPLDYYNSPELAARERHLYETSPLALVSTAELARPHDYVVRNAVGRSVLLTRDANGQAHAFLNYCRHRGAEPAKGCGNAARFSCPYHAWTYDTQGRLVGMPLKDRYDGFDFAGHGLVELPSEERHGFLWVVLTPGHPIDVAAHLGELDAEIGSLGCAQMQYYPSLPEAKLEANWKSVAEGLLEGLHLPFVHADTFNLNPQAAFLDLAFHDAIGPHIRWGLPLFDKAGAVKLRATPESEWDTKSGIGCIWLIFPGLLLSNELYGMIYADLTPGASITESYLRYGWLSPVEEAPEGMPSPRAMAARAAKAIGQDQAVWEGCGRGLARGGHDYAVIGRNEKSIQLFHERVAELIGYEGLDYA